MLQGGAASALRAGGVSRPGRVQQAQRREPAVEVRLLPGDRGVPAPPRRPDRGRGEQSPARHTQ